LMYRKNKNFLVNSSDGCQVFYELSAGAECV
jgi:hypothetical protein